MITTKAAMPNILEFKTNLEITGSFGYEFTQEVPVGKKISVGATVQAFQIRDTRSGTDFGFPPDNVKCRKQTGEQAEGGKFLRLVRFHLFKSGRAVSPVMDF